MAAVARALPHLARLLVIMTRLDPHRGTVQLTLALTFDQVEAQRVADAVGIVGVTRLHKATSLRQSVASSEPKTKPLSYL